MRIPIKQYFALLARYLRPQRGRVVLLAILIATTIGITLAKPQLIRQFIDRLAAGDPLRLVTGVALTYLLIALVEQGLQIGATYLTEDVKWRATNWLRNDLTDHCLGLDMTFHNANTPGTMIERIDGDVTELQNFFSQFLLRVVANLILLGGILILLMREDWRIGAAFSASTLVMLLTLSRAVSFGAPRWKRLREVVSDKMGFIEETLSATEDLKAAGGIPFVMLKLRRLFYEQFIGERNAFLAGEVSWTATRFFFILTDSLAFSIGGWLLLRGEISLGTVYLVWSYNRYLRRPVEELAREIRDLQSATAAIQRIAELMQTAPSVQSPPRPTSLPSGALPIAFDGVHFAYADGDGLPVLTDVSFELAAGATLGLLGRTGSGKTTVTRLLFRLFDPTAGTIRLAGKPLPTLDLNALRQKVGIVTQSVELFDATVRDNITFFDASISDARIEAALETLGLNGWLAQLPRGLDTRLSGGRGLSAGEAQLLAFTRVFLQDPGLVILDEASSRLDPATELRIERAVDRLLAGRTAIIIAHRLGTVQRADQILILEDGAVAEYGDRVLLAHAADSMFAELLRTGMEEALA